MSAPKKTVHRKKKVAFKKVEDDEATFYDGTVLYDSNLIEKYHKAVYDALMDRKPIEPNSLFPFVDKSIKGMMNASRFDLGVKSLEKLDSLVKETTEYFKSNTEANVDYIEYKISKYLFEWQKPVILQDTKKNTLLAGRRSGKSFVLSALPVVHCSKGFDTINGYNKPRSVLVMGLTSGRVKEVFWTNILHFVEVSGLKASIDNSELTIKFENGSSIFLRGNNSKVDREKLRGGDFSMIIIDECQSQQSLNYLMTDILGPIIKGRDSLVYLAGTGAITNKGYWKDVTDGSLSKEWRHFTATMKDNPTVPETALDDVLKENNWTKDNVTFRREYLAENIIDTTRIVYPVFHTYKDIEENTVFNRLCIGIDYGWHDYNAIVALGKTNKGKTYELETRKFNKSDVDNIVENVKQVWDECIQKYKIPLDNAICVADSSDQSISAQIQKKGVKIQNAYKVDRIQQILDLREELNRGDLLLKENGILTEEAECYVWKYDEENKCIIYETDDDFYHADGLPACRYAWYYLKSRKD